MIPIVIEASEYQLEGINTEEQGIRMQQCRVRIDEYKDELLQAKIHKDSHCFKNSLKP
jgi:hypothetical protein